MACMERIRVSSGGLYTVHPCAQWDKRVWQLSKVK